MEEEITEIEEKVKKKRSNQIDMLHGPLLKKLMLFALPIALSGILQQLFNSADVAVIGIFEDSVAQAAVNSNGALVNLLINLFTGLSVGVTVVIAANIGKGETGDVHSVVLTAFVIALVSGFLLLGLGIGVSEPLLRLMNVPNTAEEPVLPLAVQYLRIYFAGMPFVMFYNFGSAILRSVGDTRRPLYVLIAAGVLNAGLNVLFVAAFKMSVSGVALATVISDAFSAVAVVIFIMKDKMLKVRFGQSKIKATYLKSIFRIGLPSGIQGVVFSLSNVCIQAAINGFGEKAMAGNGDALYFEYYVYFFVSAFGQAATTFAGQNYAAGEYARCKTIFRLCILWSFVIAGVLSAIFTLGGRLFIRIYTSDEEVIEYAMIRFWLVLSCEALPTFFETPGGALRGIGNSMLPAVITLIGSCGLRIVWVYTVCAAFPNNIWILLAIYPISWVVTSAAMLAAYFVIAGKKYKDKPAPTGAQSADQGRENAVL